MLSKGCRFQQKCQFKPCGKVIFEQRLAEGEEVSHCGERAFRVERREQPVRGHSGRGSSMVTGEQ